RRRRTRHADRADHRRLCGEPRQELVHRQLPRILAVLPRLALHRRHADVAARPGRPLEKNYGPPRSCHMILEATFDNRPEGSDGADQMAHRVTGELDLSHGVALYL